MFNEKIEVPFVCVRDRGIWGEFCLPVARNTEAQAGMGAGYSWGTKLPLPGGGGAIGHAIGISGSRA
jgi:hypothetical protein